MPASGSLVTYSTEKTERHLRPRFVVLSEGTGMPDRSHLYCIFSGDSDSFMFSVGTTYNLLTEKLEDW
jgi:hypothetical protein